ncbi:MAG TPA: serine hydrolase domain-containing protein [Kofleriaceae bacterium]|nr:serine hydrolase domain-containing protein [Kofleriaceae bacterium]
MDSIVRLVDAALAAGLGSGAAVSVGDAGREVFRLVRGHTHTLPALGAPITDTTPWDLASLTKPMCTVACAMVLAGDGTLELEAPIRRWLPASTSPASVRALLGHAAGCIAHVEFFRWLRGARPADPRAALVDRAQRVPVQFTAAPVYSDLGFIQLGRIIELAANRPLEQAFADFVAGPLGLAARFAPEPIAGAVATELDERGVVTGLVHDENCFFGGRICGHAGLFGSIDDVARFAAAMVAVASGSALARFDPAIVDRFFTDAPSPGHTWRLGWDTPSPTTPGISQAGDRWPRAGSVGHTGFTGTSIWLDVPRKRWFVVLTNRVHPTRFGESAAQIKALRRAIGDAVVAELA